MDRRWRGGAGLEISGKTTDAVSGPKPQVAIRTSVAGTPVDQVKNQEDPDVLNAYKKAFKKQVPFALRSWVAAYMLKEMGQKQGRGRKTIADGMSIFVSIGPSILLRMQSSPLLKNGPICFGPCAIFRLMLSREKLLRW